MPTDAPRETEFVWMWAQVVGVEAAAGEPGGGLAIELNELENWINWLRLLVQEMAGSGFHHSDRRPESPRTDRRA